MNIPWENHIGKQINNWLIIEKASDTGDKYYDYRCKCLLCGNIYTVNINNILKELSKGCQRCSLKSPRKHKYIVSTCDKKYARIYRIWDNLKKRSGMVIPPEWLNDFNKFFADTYQTYADNLYLSRIDKTKSLGADNFKWGTKRDVGERKPRSAVTVNGVTKSKSEWARFLDITRQAFDSRMKTMDKSRWIIPKGDSIVKPETYNSKYSKKYGMKAKQISAELGVSMATVYYLAKQDRLEINNNNITVLGK